MTPEPINLVNVIEEDEHEDEDDLLFWYCQAVREERHCPRMGSCIRYQFKEGRFDTCVDLTFTTNPDEVDARNGGTNDT